MQDDPLVGVLFSTTDELRPKGAWSLGPFFTSPQSIASQATERTIKLSERECETVAHETKICLLSYPRILSKFARRVTQLPVLLLVASNIVLHGRYDVMEAVGRIKSGMRLWALCSKGQV